MSNAIQMTLMVKLAAAKNALTSVKTALACIDDAESSDRSEFLKYNNLSYYDSAKFDLRKAASKLELEVEFLTEQFQKYVKFIPANKETV
jgi:hypothetical protein